MKTGMILGLGAAALGLLYLGRKKDEPQAVIETDKGTFVANQYGQIFDEFGTIVDKSSVLYQQVKALFDQQSPIITKESKAGDIPGITPYKSDVGDQSMLAGSCCRRR